MNQLYPIFVTRTNLPVIRKIALLSITFIIYSAVAVSQTGGFTAQLVNDKVCLAWTTIRESDVSHYSIERSYDNKTFEQAALLFTADNPSSVNSYSYKDPVKNAAPSVIYYRLKMVDKDGKYIYSEIRTVRSSEGNESARITTYPNPVVNELHIEVPAGWQNMIVSGQLLNTNGSIIKSFNIHQVATIVMTDVPAGTYYLKVTNGKDTTTQAIIKSKN